MIMARIGRIAGTTGSRLRRADKMTTSLPTVAYKQILGNIDIFFRQLNIVPFDDNIRRRLHDDADALRRRHVRFRYPVHDSQHLLH